jgi:hypothetical protein
MSDTFEPAIEALKQQLVKEEKRLGETRSLINRLCEMAGRPRMVPDTDLPTLSNTSPSRPQGFSGTRLSMAVQDYMNLPRPRSLGPLSRFEISV